MKPKYDANHPFDPDVRTALCMWCAVLWVHEKSRPLEMTL